MATQGVAVIYLLRRWDIRLTACDILLSQSDIFAFANVYRFIVDVTIYNKNYGVSQASHPTKDSKTEINSGLSGCLFFEQSHSAPERGAGERSETDGLLRSNDI